jgi:hypothetical protein
VAEIIGIDGKFGHCLFRSWLERVVDHSSTDAMSHSRLPPN